MSDIDVTISEEVREDISKVHYYTSCMLCDRSITIYGPIHHPIICDECKAMWRSLLNQEEGGYKCP